MTEVIRAHFHAKGFRVKLFKARYFERRICLKSNAIETKPKQSQFSQFVENIYIYNQFYLNELVLCFCF